MSHYFSDFLTFVYKQAYACIFGAFLLAMIIMSKYWYPFDDILYRYDFLFISAVVFQWVLILIKLESHREVAVILIFHMIAMMMEVFKTHPSIGSWSYPEYSYISLGWVPLFAGFMYSAVGSYIARVWRILDFRFARYPKQIYTILIALTIYINFFTHHFIWDLRYAIIIGVLLIFGKTTIFFTPHRRTYSMNLVIGFVLVASCIWIAENIATYMRIWIYPSQSVIWHMVSIEKITAWFLLMIISFVLISFINSPKPR
jgi:uncharacterized membrane protein YoaT (DUF817 family)